MRIFSGQIICCDEQNTVSKYLVEDGGRIIYVGDKLPASCTGTAETVELGNKALLPAFGDGHIHYSNWAFFNMTFDVRSAETLNDLAPIIKRYAKKNRGTKVLLGFGHSMHSVAEKRVITRSELDQIIKDRPVYLVCYDGHSAVANTAAIGMLPTSIRSCRGFDLESGYLTREAFFKATNHMSGRVPVTFLLKAIRRGFDTLADNGVGLIHSVEGVGFPRDLDVDLLRFLGSGAFQELRIYFQTLDVDKVIKRGLPRIGGCFSCALDGCFGVRDAALLEPYEDEPGNNGVLYYNDKEVKEFAVRANRQGLQIQMHCIGDAAVVQAVDALEAALEDTPRLDHRHTLIHACLIPDQYMEKIARLKIGITLQPSFLVSPLEPSSYLRDILGDRALKSSPLRRMLDMGIRVSGGSDAPVEAPNPIEGIFGACNHTNPQQSVSVQEALRMFTYNIAYTSFDELERGSLEKGKIADMIVLNRNPLELEAKDLLKLKVEKLYLSGVEYRKGRKITNLIVSSIKNRKRVI